jgi:hypothetical protein
MIHAPTGAPLGSDLPCLRKAIRNAVTRYLCAAVLMIVLFGAALLTGYLASERLMGV